MTAILMHFALIPMDRLIATAVLDTLVTERHVLVSIIKCKFYCLFHFLEKLHLLKET